MNEYETHPQRHVGSSEELSHQPADATQQDSGTPAGGQSSYGEQPTAQQPPAQQPAAGAGSPAPQPVTPKHQPWASPWQQHYGAYQQPHPGYGYQQAEQPQYAYAGPGGGVPPQQPTQEVPIWAAPVGTEPQRDPEHTRRTKRILATGAAAVVLALAAGGVGAATALALDDNGGSAGIKTTNSSVERVVDRSSLAQIAASVRDSVVSITTESGEGSGVIVDAKGNIVTNNHVVATAQGDTVQVIFASGKKSTATIVGTDPRTDLAVVRVQDTSGLKPAQFGSSAQMQVGDTVLAIGSPLGL